MRSESALARARALMEDADRRHDAGRLADAERAYRRAATMLRRQPSAKALHSRALTQLGYVQQTQGRYRSAARTLRHAIAVCETASGPHSLDTAVALNGLGVCYKYLARFGEAAALYGRALRIANRRVSGRSLAASLHHNIGGLAHAAGRAGEGEWHAREAVRLRRQLHGPNHPDVAADMAALAGVLDQQGKYGEATRLYRRAIALFTDAFGPNHMEIATSLNNLAAIHQQQRRLAVAERLYQRAWTITVQHYGTRHLQTGVVASNLAALLLKRGRARAAMSWNRRALRVLEESLGSDHPTLGTVRHNEAAILDRLARDRAAPADRDELTRALTPA